MNGKINDGVLWRFRGFPFLVYKKSADATRSRVEVFIRTPYSEIDIPFVQRHGHIPDRMSEIPATQASLETFSSVLRCKQRSFKGLGSTPKYRV